MRFLLILAISAFSTASFAYSRFFSGYYVMPDLTNTAAESHVSGAAAALNKRKLIGGSFGSAESETKTNGVKESELEADGIGLQWFQPHANGFATEFTVTDTSGDDQDFNPTSPKDKTEEFDWLLNSGIQLPDGNGVFGFTFGLEKSEVKDGSTGDTETDKGRRLGISYSRMLEGDLRLGFGLLQLKSSPETGASDDDNFYFIGLGKMWGGAETPDMVAEFIFNYYNEEGAKIHELFTQGLINQGQLQYTGSFSIADVNNTDVIKRLEFDLNVGVNYNFRGFYIAPGVGYYTAKTDVDTSGGIDSKENATSWQVEAGYKMAVHHFYAQYIGGNSKDEETSNGSDVEKVKSSGYTVGYDYYF